MVVFAACTDDLDDNGPSPAQLNNFLETLDAKLLEVDGPLVDGTLPFDAQNTSFKLISRPDQITAKEATGERIDLVFETDSNISEVYFSVAGADRHYVFPNTTLDPDAPTEAVSLKFSIPQTPETDNFCALISVKDQNGRLSNAVQVCVTVDNTRALGRDIYFADFSPNSTLSTLNFNTSEVQVIGATGVELTDIAFIGDKLYGLGRQELYLIDTTTGEASLVANLDVEGLNALEGDSNTLYAATIAGEFLTIDPITGATKVLSNFEDGAVSSGDLVFPNTQNFLYGTLIQPGYSTDRLVSIIPSTGATTYIGETRFNFVFGLAFFRNQLLGLTDIGAYIIIDPETGLGTLVEFDPAFSAGGAAATPTNM